MTAALVAAPPLPDTRASLRLVGWLAGSWALLVGVGVISLVMPDALAAGHRVGFTRALFTSANVAAGAGFAQDYARPDDFAAPVQAVFVLQTLAGGLLGLAGGGVLLARWLGRPHSDGKLTAAALLLLAVGAVLGLFTGGSPGAAAFRGVSAVACSGVHFGPDVRANSLAFTLVLMPLSLVGSLGVVVLCDACDAVRRLGPLSPHAARVLTLTAAVYLVGVGAIALTLGGPPWPKALVGANAVVSAARGDGFPNQPASAWPAATVWISLLVMAVGTGTAGAAGSVGLGWLATLPGKARDVVINGLLGQAMLLSATVLVLAQTEVQLNTVRRLTLSLSAVMNAGLSHEPVSIAGKGLVVLGVCVLAAKVLPLAVIASALRTPRDPA